MVACMHVCCMLLCECPPPPVCACLGDFPADGSAVSEDEVLHHLNAQSTLRHAHTQ